MDRLSLLFWSFVVVLGALLLNQVGQWAGGPAWYEKDAWLAFAFLVFIVYIMLVIRVSEYLVTALFVIGLVLYVAIPSVVVFYASYLLASRVPTVKELAVLLLFIFVCSIAAGLIKQGRIDKRRLLPDE